jgi:hypothetical protein
MLTVKIAGKDIELNEDLLKFDEHSINEFLQKFAAKYNEYYAYHSDAQFILSKYEDKYDATYAEKFKMYREESSSDKMAEMKTKSDPSVQEALENVRVSKRNVNMLWGYLRSMDRAFDFSKEYSYNLRKEMDKIFKGISDLNS